MKTAAAALALLAAYLASWGFRRELGIVRSAANTRYFTDTDDPKLDRPLHVLYWPCYRLFSDVRHNSDRPAWISPAEQGP